MGEGTRGWPLGDRVEEAEDKQLSSQHHHQDPGHPSTPEAPLAPLGWPHPAPLIVFPSAEASGACLRTSQNVRMASSSHLRPGALWPCPWEAPLAPLWSDAAPSSPDL